MVSVSTKLYHVAWEQSDNTEQIDVTVFQLNCWKDRRQDGDLAWGPCLPTSSAWDELYSSCCRWSPVVLALTTFSAPPLLLAQMSHILGSSRPCLQAELCGLGQLPKPYIHTPSHFDVIICCKVSLLHQSIKSFVVKTVSQLYLYPLDRAYCVSHS